MNVNPKTRPLPLIEGGFEITKTTLNQNEKFPMVFQVQDINGSLVDVTSGTVSTLIYNSNSAPVSTTGTTTTKSLASSGLITFDGYTWATTGTFNLYISYVVSGNTRIFGPYRVIVRAL